MGMRLISAGLNDNGWMKVNTMIDGAELTLSFNANGIDKARLDQILEQARTLLNDSVELHHEAVRYCRGRDSLTIGSPK
ncbi:MAG: hypothetical protein H6867_01785 [Rhodospirillales bacterium]|nr:hypothetical protein [Rhodospirillales bacterium]MCB9997249.1 hypothetical protein [Rhodospirillales bacterium]